MGKGKAQIGSRILHASPLEDLPNQPTRLLLAELRRMRVQATRYEYDGVDCCTDCDGHELAAHERARARDVGYVQALKAELAKRPHIPNKPEAKLIRQAKAKEQRAR